MKTIQLLFLVHLFCSAFAFRDTLSSTLELISKLFPSLNNNNDKAATTPPTLLQVDPITSDIPVETRVWLTVASTVNITDNRTLVRTLEVHWQRTHPPSRNDYLAIYNVNTSQVMKRFALYNQYNKTISSYLTTDIEFPYVNASELIANPNKTNKSNFVARVDLDKCLNYYLVYVNESHQLEAFNCIHLNAHWMRDNYAVLRNHALIDIMIPGTHDTSSYKKYDNDYEQNIIERFQYTQDETIFNQLAYGIRYIDCRVGAYNDTHFFDRNSDSLFTEQLWMVHDIQRNQINLTEALRQVKKFIQQTTHEIVIVDFHRFVNGFDGVDDTATLSRRLKLFQQTVLNELQEYLIPFNNYGTHSIDNLVQSGRRVLLGYAYKSDTRRLPDSYLFWPAVQHLWAETDEMNKLEAYMEKNLCGGGRNKLQAMMAQLTPTIQGIIFLKYHGLRELASNVNINFDEWFRHQYWNCTNIVTADFFLGSDIVQIAIDVNQRRFGNRTKSIANKPKIGNLLNKN